MLYLDLELPIFAIGPLYLCLLEIFSNPCRV